MADHAVLVGAVQYRPVSMDPEANVRRMVEWIERAASEGRELVVFPELSDSGYVPWPQTRRGVSHVGRLASVAQPIPGMLTEVLGEAAHRRGVYVVAGVLEADPAIEGRLYNSCVLISPTGALVGVHRKVVLSMAEGFFFSRGNRLDVFDTELGRIGMSICYDALFPEHARVQTLSGMEIYCVVWNTACPPPAQPEDRVPVGYLPEHLALASQMRAVENGVFVVSAHRVGWDSIAGADFMGLTRIISPWGTVMAEAPPAEETLLCAEFDRSLLAEARAHRPFLKDRRPELYERLTVWD